MVQVGGTAFSLSKDAGNGAPTHLRGIRELYPMKRSLKAGATALTLLAGLGTFGGGALADTYKVTVYNLTKGQIFNPTFVAAHSRRV